MKNINMQDSKPLIMGIMNITPDSFSDGGKLKNLFEIRECAIRLKEEGADILDIGAESTRPNAEIVSLEEELRRIEPVLEILQDIDIPLSVDTYKPEVMKLALQYGVTMINDINALQFPNALETVEKYRNENTLVCLMHMQKMPKTMQQNPTYNHVILDILDFLEDRIQAVESIGMTRDQILVDVGFGFGKNLDHNIELFKNLERFKILKSKMLVGISRKSMLGEITNNPVQNRSYESVIGAILAIQKGAKIVRVHDVKATKDALKIYDALN